MGFPLMLWAQLVRGDSPTQAGLLLAPMAVMSIVLAPVAGKLTDRVHPRILAGAGLVVLALSLVLLAAAIGPDTPLWQVLGAMALLGVGSSFVWAPLTTTANRNLPLHQAGAGSGIYNANRQIGSVVGAAAIAVLIDSRLAANGLGEGGGAERGIPRRHPARGSARGVQQRDVAGDVPAAGGAGARDRGRALLRAPAALRRRPGACG